MNEPSLLIFSFYAHDSGDSYLVEFDSSGFIEALRYPLSTWMSARAYEHLADIPEPHRSGIANEIARRIHK